jgi:hypothetical protein
LIIAAEISTSALWRKPPNLQQQMGVNRSSSSGAEFDLQRESEPTHLA